MTQKQLNEALYASFLISIGDFTERQDFVVIIAKIIANTYGLRYK